MKSTSRSVVIYLKFTSNHNRSFWLIEIAHVVIYLKFTSNHNIRFHGF